MFAILFTLFVHLSISRAGDPCPPESVLAPCTCSRLHYQNSSADHGWISFRHSDALPTHEPVTTSAPRTKREANSTTPLPPPSDDAFYTVVECGVCKTLTDLEETVSFALDRKIVDTLIVANVPPSKDEILARLPSGWLRKVRIRQFEIQKSKLFGDFISYGNPFEGQAHSLLRFAVNNCLLTGALSYDTQGTVNTKGLENLPNIEEIDFSHNFLAAIWNEAFNNPPRNLSSVILSHNSITYIGYMAFEYIPLLKNINLSHNLLETIPNRMFGRTAKYLERIDLSWNSLSELPDNFFIGMPALKSVKLSNNFLYSMPEAPWGVIWEQLTYIDVTDNFIDCNCDLMWLLPILSPPVVNVTSTTPAPVLLKEQMIEGMCTKIIKPLVLGITYALSTLTRSRLNC